MVGNSSSGGSTTADLGHFGYGSSGGLNPQGTVTISPSPAACATKSIALGPYTADELRQAGVKVVTPSATQRPRTVTLQLPASQTSRTVLPGLTTTNQQSQVIQQPQKKVVIIKNTKESIGGKPGLVSTGLVGTMVTYPQVRIGAGGNALPVTAAVNTSYGLPTAAIPGHPNTRFILLNTSQPSQSVNMGGTSVVNAVPTISHTGISKQTQPIMGTQNMRSVIKSPRIRLKFPDGSVQEVDSTALHNTTLPCPDSGKVRVHDKNLVLVRGFDGSLKYVRKSDIVSTSIQKPQETEIPEELPPLQIESVFSLQDPSISGEMTSNIGDAGRKQRTRLGKITRKDRGTYQERVIDISDSEGSESDVICERVEAHVNLIDDEEEQGDKESSNVINIDEDTSANDKDTADDFEVEMNPDWAVDSDRDNVQRVTDTGQQESSGGSGSKNDHVTDTPDGAANPVIDLDSEHTEKDGQRNDPNNSLIDLDNSVVDPDKLVIDLDNQGSDNVISSDTNQSLEGSPAVVNLDSSQETISVANASEQNVNSDLDDEGTPSLAEGQSSHSSVGAESHPEESLTPEVLDKNSTPVEEAGGDGNSDVVHSTESVDSNSKQDEQSEGSALSHEPEDSPSQEEQDPLSQKDQDFLAPESTRSSPQRNEDMPSPENKHSSPKQVNSSPVEIPAATVKDANALKPVCDPTHEGVTQENPVSVNVIGHPFVSTESLLGVESLQEQTEVQNEIATAVKDALSTHMITQHDSSQVPPF